jgi:hypothetical protein
LPQQFVLIAVGRHVGMSDIEHDSKIRVPKRANALGYREYLLSRVQRQMRLKLPGDAHASVSSQA